MNAYGIAILLALVAAYALRVIAGVLNVRHMPQEPPAALADVVDAGEYRRSVEYTRVRTRFGLAWGAFDLAVLVAFWLAGGFGALDGWVRGLGLGALATGLAFIGILVIGRTLLDLPWSVWSTFVIEERFGFNRSTPRTFVLDRVKGAALTVAIGGPILAAVLWFFRETGPLAWLWAWALVTVVGLVLQWAAPRYLMPIFNEFWKLEDDELREAILRYADSVGFSIDELYVMDASRRSSRTNALFTGFGRNRRVILFDTLVERHTVPELVAIVAHEVGHYRLRHIPQRVALGLLHTGVLFLMLWLFLQTRGVYDAFGVERATVYAGLVFFSIAYGPVAALLAIPLNAWSRRHEYQADRYAAETTGRPETMAAALKKLAAHNLSDLSPHPLRVLLDYSHPPVAERVAALGGTA